MTASLMVSKDVVRCHKHDLRSTLVALHEAHYALREDFAAILLHSDFRAEALRGEYYATSYLRHRIPLLFRLALYEWRPKPRVSTSREVEVPQSGMSETVEGTEAEAGRVAGSSHPFGCRAFNTGGSSEERSGQEQDAEGSGLPRSAGGLVCPPLSTSSLEARTTMSPPSLPLSSSEGRTTSFTEEESMRLGVLANQILCGDRSCIREASAEASTAKCGPIWDVHTVRYLFEEKAHLIPWACQILKTACAWLEGAVRLGLEDELVVNESTSSLSSLAPAQRMAKEGILRSACSGTAPPAASAPSTVVEHLCTSLLLDSCSLQPGLPQPPSTPPLQPPPSEEEESAAAVLPLASSLRLPSMQVSSPSSGKEGPLTPCRSPPLPPPPHRVLSADVQHIVDASGDGAAVSFKAPFSSIPEFEAALNLQCRRVRHAVMLLESLLVALVMTPSFFYRRPLHVSADSLPRRRQDSRGDGRTALNGAEQGADESGTLPCGRCSVRGGTRLPCRMCHSALSHRATGSEVFAAARHANDTLLLEDNDDDLMPGIEEEEGLRPSFPWATEHATEVEADPLLRVLVRYVMHAFTHTFLSITAVQQRLQDYRPEQHHTSSVVEAGIVGADSRSSSTAEVRGVSEMADRVAAIDIPSTAGKGSGTPLLRAASKADDTLANDSGPAAQACVTCQRFHRVEELLLDAVVDNLQTLRRSTVAVAAHHSAIAEEAIRVMDAGGPAFTSQATVLLAHVLVPEVLAAHPPGSRGGTALEWVLSYVFGGCSSADVKRHQQQQREEQKRHQHLTDFSDFNSSLGCFSIADSCRRSASAVSRSIGTNEADLDCGNGVRHVGEDRLDSSEGDDAAGDSAATVTSQQHRRGACANDDGDVGEGGGGRDTVPPQWSSEWCHGRDKDGENVLQHPLADGAQKVATEMRVEYVLAACFARCHPLMTVIGCVAENNQYNCGRTVAQAVLQYAFTLSQTSARLLRTPLETSRWSTPFTEAMMRGLSELAAHAYQSTIIPSAAAVWASPTTSSVSSTQATLPTTKVAACTGASEDRPPSASPAFTTPRPVQDVKTNSSPLLFSPPLAPHVPMASSTFPWPPRRMQSFSPPPAVAITGTTPMEQQEAAQARTLRRCLALRWAKCLLLSARTLTRAGVESVEVPHDHYINILAAQRRLSERMEGYRGRLQARAGVMHDKARLQRMQEAFDQYDVEEQRVMLQDVEKMDDPGGNVSTMTEQHPSPTTPGWHARRNNGNLSFDSMLGSGGCPVDPQSALCDLSRLHSRYGSSTVSAACEALSLSPGAPPLLVDVDFPNEGHSRSLIPRSPEAPPVACPTGEPLRDSASRRVNQEEHRRAFVDSFCFAKSDLELLSAHLQRQARRVVAVPIHVIVFTSLFTILDAVGDVLLCEMPRLSTVVTNELLTLLFEAQLSMLEPVYDRAMEVVVRAESATATSNTASTSSSCAGFFALPSRTEARTSQLYDARLVPLGSSASSPLALSKGSAALSISSCSSANDEKKICGDGGVVILPQGPEGVLSACCQGEGETEGAPEWRADTIGEVQIDEGPSSLLPHAKKLATTGHSDRTSPTELTPTGQVLLFSEYALLLEAGLRIAQVVRRWHAEVKADVDHAARGYVALLQHLKRHQEQWAVATVDAYLVARSTLRLMLGVTARDARGNLHGNTLHVDDLDVTGSRKEEMTPLLGVTSSMDALVSAVYSEGWDSSKVDPADPFSSPGAPPSSSKAAASALRRVMPPTQQLTPLLGSTAVTVIGGAWSNSIEGRRDCSDLLGTPAADEDEDSSEEEGERGEVDPEEAADEAADDAPLVDAWMPSQMLPCSSGSYDCYHHMMLNPSQVVLFPPKACATRAVPSPTEVPATGQQALSTDVTGTLPAVFAASVPRSSTPPRPARPPSILTMPLTQSSFDCFSLAGSGETLRHDFTAEAAGPPPMIASWGDRGDRREKEMEGGETDVAGLHWWPPLPVEKCSSERHTAATSSAAGKEEKEKDGDTEDVKEKDMVKAAAAGAVGAEGPAAAVRSTSASTVLPSSDLAAVSSADPRAVQCDGALGTPSRKSSTHSVAASSGQLDRPAVAVLADAAEEETPQLRSPAGIETRCSPRPTRVVLAGTSDDLRAMLLRMPTSWTVTNRPSECSTPITGAASASTVTPKPDGAPTRPADDEGRVSASPVISYTQVLTQETVAFLALGDDLHSAARVIEFTPEQMVEGALSAEGFEAVPPSISFRLQKPPAGTDNFAFCDNEDSDATQVCNTNAEAVGSPADVMVMRAVSTVRCAGDLIGAEDLMAAAHDLEKLEAGTEHTPSLDVTNVEATAMHTTVPPALPRKPPPAADRAPSDCAADVDGAEPAHRLSRLPVGSDFDGDVMLKSSSSGGVGASASDAPTTAPNDNDGACAKHRFPLETVSQTVSHTAHPPPNGMQEAAVPALLLRDAEEGSCSCSPVDLAPTKARKADQQQPSVSGTRQQGAGAGETPVLLSTSAPSAQVPPPLTITSHASAPAPRRLFSSHSLWHHVLAQYHHDATTPPMATAITTTPTTPAAFATDGGAALAHSGGARAAPKCRGAGGVPTTHNLSAEPVPFATSAAVVTATTAEGSLTEQCAASSTAPLKDTLRAMSGQARVRERRLSPILTPEVAAFIAQTSICVADPPSERNPPLASPTEPLQAPSMTGGIGVSTVTSPLFLSDSRRSPLPTAPYDYTAHGGADEERNSPSSVGSHHDLLWYTGRGARLTPSSTVSTDDTVSPFANMETLSPDDTQLILEAAAAAASSPLRDRVAARSNAHYHSPLGRSVTSAVVSAAISASSSRFLSPNAVLGPHGVGEGDHLSRPWPAAHGVYLHHAPPAADGPFPTTNTVPSDGGDDAGGLPRQAAQGPANARSLRSRSRGCSDTAQAAGLVWVARGRSPLGGSKEKTPVPPPPPSPPAPPPPPPLCDTPHSTQNTTARTPSLFAHGLTSGPPRAVVLPQRPAGFCRRGFAEPRQTAGHAGGSAVVVGQREHTSARAVAAAAARTESISSNDGEVST